MVASWEDRDRYCFFSSDQLPLLTTNYIFVFSFRTDSELLINNSAFLVRLFLSQKPGFFKKPGFLAHIPLLSSLDNS